MHTQGWEHEQKAGPPTGLADRKEGLSDALAPGGDGVTNV